MAGSTGGAARDGRGADPFSFGAADLHRQGMLNLVTLATLPWAAAIAMAAEFAALAARRRD
jgi:hypothetical protein